MRKKKGENILSHENIFASRQRLRQTDLTTKFLSAMKRVAEKRRDYHFEEAEQAQVEAEEARAWAEYYGLPDPLTTLDVANVTIRPQTK